MLRRLTTIPALLLVLVAGCLGTPQPDPPNVIGIDPTRVLGSGSDGPPTVWIRGEPGAVVPADALLRIYSLDREDPAVDVVPETDGSFSVEVPGQPYEEFRLQVTLGEDRAPPVDIVVETDYVQLAPRPLADCLTTSPVGEAPVPVGGRATVRLVNECVQPVAVARIVMRRPASPFTVVSPAAPIEVPAGGTLPIVVEHPAGVDDLGEEVLLLEVSAPLPDHRPVTLLGTP